MTPFITMLFKIRISLLLYAAELSVKSIILKCRADFDARRKKAKKNDCKNNGRRFRKDCQRYTLMRYCMGESRNVENDGLNNCKKRAVQTLRVFTRRFPEVTAPFSLLFRLR
jgi:hypothetical protein